SETEPRGAARRRPPRGPVRVRPAQPVGSTRGFRPARRRAWRLLLRNSVLPLLATNLAHAPQTRGTPMKSTVRILLSVAALALTASFALAADSTPRIDRREARQHARIHQ